MFAPRSAVCCVMFACLMPAAACSSSKALKVDNPFPKRDALTRLASAPPQQAVAIDPGVAVDRMMLAQPLYDQLGATPLTPGTPLEAKAAAALAQTPATLTREASCVARQYALFYATHDALPYATLQAFIRHRCGSTIGSESTMWWSVERKNEGGLEQAAFEEETRQKMFGDGDFLQKISQAIVDQAKGQPEHAEVGVSLGQVGEKVVVMVTFGAPTVRLADAPVYPAAGGTVTLRGTSLRPGTSVYGMVTLGAFDHEMCSTDATVPMPQFAITCPTLATDARSRLVLFLREKDAIFATPIHDQSVWPLAGAQGVLPPAEFVSSRPSTLTPVDPGAPLPGQMLDLINQVRALAGRTPLELATAQSQMNTQLLPHLLDAFRAQDRQREREVSMGVMAGWEIQGPVVDGNMMLFRFAQDQPLGMLEGIMDLPHGRSLLFGKDSKKLALGLLADAQGDLGMLASVYDFLPNESNPTRIARVLTRLQKARKLQGQNPIKRSKRLVAKRQQLAKALTAGQMSLDEVAEALAEEAVKSYDKGVSYYSYVVHDLDKMQFGKELLQARGKRAMVFVAPYNQEGYPWTIYGVVVVVI